MAIAVTGRFPDIYPYPYLSTASFQTPIHCHSCPPASFQTPIHGHSCFGPVSRHICMDIAVTGQFPDIYLWKLAVAGQFPDTYPWPELLPASSQTHIHGHSCYRSVFRHLFMAIAVTGQFPATYLWPELLSASFQLTCDS
jgi:hypothetical protein